jgi:ABC-2 type transport system permease protein
MLLPAAISIYKVASVGGGPVLVYSHYAYSMSLFLIVFVAVAAPELVSRDLRHHTLPLYFSRPLRRSDYPLAKLLALASAIALFEALPLLVMYLGIIASSTSGSGVWNQTRDLVPGLLVALAYGAAFAPLTLLIASMTGRRAIVTGAIAILFLATSAVSHVFQSVGTHYSGPPDRIEQPSRAPAPNDQIQPGQQPEPPAFKVTTSYDSIARYGGLVDPLLLVEGTRIWALDATDGNMPDPGNGGALYAFELAVLTGLTTGGLFLRYRKVGVA